MYFVHCRISTSQPSQFRPFRRRYLHSQSITRLIRSGLKEDGAVKLDDIYPALLRISLMCAWDCKLVVDGQNHNAVQLSWSRSFRPQSIADHTADPRPRKCRSGSQIHFPWPHHGRRSRDGRGQLPAPMSCFPGCSSPGRREKKLYVPTRPFPSKCHSVFFCKNHEMC